MMQFAAQNPEIVALVLREHARGNKFANAGYNGPSWESHRVPISVMKESPYYKENTIEDVIEALQLIEAATKDPKIDQSLFLRDVMEPGR